MARALHLAASDNLELSDIRRHVVNTDIGRVDRLGRRLAQDAEDSLEILNVSPSFFNLTNAEAILNLGRWYRNPVYSVTCGGDAGPYVVGPANPDLCVELLQVVMSSSLFGNVTVEFDTEELNNLKTVDPDDPTRYAFGLPLSEYAVPNALYDTLEFNVTFLNGPPVGAVFNGNMFNYFNASASSLREYYGVDPNLQGTDQTIQGSVLIIGYKDSAVNTTAVSKYLELQDLVPNVPVQIPYWAPPNDVSVCPKSQLDACGETMLDVETQQAFAPQAVTYFAPTEFLQDVMVPRVTEALDQAGYTEKEIMEQLTMITSVLDEGVDVKQLDTLTLDALADIWVEYFMEFVANVIEAKERVQVVSLSWSADFTLGGSLPWDTFEGALKNLTLSGVTILVSSSDAGASGNHLSGKGCYPSFNPLVANRYNESWPAVSPWVTTVGGTQFLATENNTQTEVVCSSATGGGITSGGGFAGTAYPSDVYSTPAWQKTAVQRYLSENNASTFAAFPTEDTPGYNPNGRAYPDISMYGAWFPTLNYAGNISIQSGTSLSAPMAAALFTLANQALLESGYETIGYANPMLYWMGENCTDAFNDITIGNNQAGQDGTQCLFGFPAAPGWDTATGLGSIRFGPFVECAKRYQDEVRSKGLELLPDGSYLPTSTSTRPSTAPSSSMGLSVVPMVLLVACILRMS